MTTRPTKEEWDAKEKEHCDFWMDVKGQRLLQRPYPWSEPEEAHEVRRLREALASSQASLATSSGVLAAVAGERDRLAHEVMRLQQQLEYAREREGADNKRLYAGLEELAAKVKGLVSPP